MVAVRPLYGGTDHLLATGLLGTEVTWAEPDGIAAAIRPDTGLVICETPANPTLELLDISDAVAQAGEVPVLVDSTFATPVLQQPAQHGAALVMHSATKFLGGHGDVVGGVVACEADWAVRLRAVRAITGALLHPLAALPAAARTAHAAAARAGTTAHRDRDCSLAQRPSGDHRRAPPEPAGRRPDGTAGQAAVRAGKPARFRRARRGPAARGVADSLQLITHAVSLGGIDSLLQHPASLTHRPVEASARPHESLLRMSVGLEDTEDLIADLDNALRQR